MTSAASAEPTAVPTKKKIQKKRKDDGPEYNYRELPGNSTSLDLAVHCGSWESFGLMMASVRF